MCSEEVVMKILRFRCLNGNDVISRKISDHHPLIHEGVFFWNIMMQCNKRGEGFNNGFALIEKDKAYKNRLVKVAQVIAEAVQRTPAIEVISLCEGPIHVEHVEVFFKALMKFPCMARFIQQEMFHKPHAEGQNWGLLTLTDTRYSVTHVPYDALDKHPKLTNRFQLLKLQQADKEKYIALAHFPFAGDHDKTEKTALSVQGQAYCNLINTLLQQYRQESLIFCGDFNLNPYLISHLNERVFDKISHNNSILLTMKGVARVIKSLTVDGVLLSRKEKQRYNDSRPQLELMRLKAEHRFFQSHIKQVVADLKQRKQETPLI